MAGQEVPDGAAGLEAELVAGAGELKATASEEYSLADTCVNALEPATGEEAADSEYCEAAEVALTKVVGQTVGQLVMVMTVVRNVVEV